MNFIAKCSHIPNVKIQAEFFGSLPDDLFRSLKPNVEIVAITSNVTTSCIVEEKRKSEEKLFNDFTAFISGHEDPELNSVIPLLEYAKKIQFENDRLRFLTKIEKIVPNNLKRKFQHLSYKIRNMGELTSKNRDMSVI